MNHLELVTKIALFSVLAFITACNHSSGDAEDSILAVEDNNATYPIQDIEFDDVCDEPAISPRIENSEFYLSPIKASYFEEVDNMEGVPNDEGTNGSDPSIERQFVLEEMVERVALNYFEKDFNNIDAEQIYGVWESEIVVESDTSTIFAGFDFNYADITFTLNDKVIARMERKCVMQIPLVLDKGVHPFKVEWHNHRFVAEFNVSFNNYESISVAEGPIGDSYDSSEYEVVYAQVFDSSSLDFSLPITLPETNKRIILVLNSTRAVNWVVLNPNNIEIEKVLFNSHRPQSSIIGVDDNKIIHVHDLSSFDGEIGAQINSLTGLNISYSRYAYSPSEIVFTETDVPSLEQLYGAQQPILSNLQGVSKTPDLEDVTHSNQEIATYMPLDSDTVLANIEWSFWYPATRTWLTNEDFVLRIYNGESQPSNEVFVQQISVKASKFYDAGDGAVYKAKFTAEAELISGNYWISIQHESNIDTTGIVMENGEQGAGGAYRHSKFGFWYSTVNDVDPTEARGASINVKGYIK